MREEIADWVGLNMIRGIGPLLANKLLREFRTPANIFTASRRLLERHGLGVETIRELHGGEVLERAAAEIERAEALGIRLVVLADEEYPPLLREIHDPPLALYIRGNREAVLAQPCLAVVGARRSSSYGVNAARSLARELAGSGMTIVSGLARGVDGAAHRGALEAGGLTVAVVGTGLDSTYPREHASLAEEIVATGALISEFPLGTPPLPQNFPYRNRILSGISFGVLVVEAAEHSGSLITARLATEQGREVFAVPGNITSQTSFGPNYLIKDGAKLVQCGNDVLVELPRRMRERLAGIEWGDDAVTGVPRAQATLESLLLSDSERRIYDLLSADVPAHVDQLLIASGLAASEMMSALLALEMKDRITQLPGKSFLRRL